MPYYAVAKGNATGVFNTWAECSASIKGFKGAKYKKFDSHEEAELFVKQTSVDDSEYIDIDYCVYTDGSCVDNGKPSAKAGIGIYFGEYDERNISKRVEGKQSNNTAELGAIIYLYKIIENDLRSGKNIAIVSDSEYAIKCVTSYGKKCHSENWIKDIPNKDMVRNAYELYKNFPNVHFVHIMAHTGKDDIHSKGNEGADALANLAIGHTQCPYVKIYLNVPFACKDEAKTLGARWDATKKKWYIFDNASTKTLLLEKFS